MTNMLISDNIGSVFAITIYAVLSRFVRGVSAGDQSHCPDAMSSRTECYECSTRGDPAQSTQFCADPFNSSHPDVRTIVCQGPCAKWVQRPASGPEYYVRTCSTKLHLRLVISLVCMKESHPANGQLCFCQRELCNSAPLSLLHHVTTFNSSLLVLTLLQLLVAMRL